MAEEDRVTTKLADAEAPSDGAELGQGDIVDGRYRLDRFLSRGGMGRVWQATDLDLGREIAIKLMHAGLVTTDSARERFLREAQAAARLHGPNVVALLDVKIENSRGVPYLTMELLRGEDLARRLERGPLSYAQTMAVIADVCAAIAEAHAQGIVHRDLKPGNIFLVEGEAGVVAKVLDFGIVKSLRAEALETGPRLTMNGIALGTVTYMSPEQAEDAHGVDQRADLWSIAALTFECLTGKRAFRAKSLTELVREFDGPRVVPSKIADNLPPGFDAWFARATHRDINRRFATVGTLLDALAALDQEELSRPITAEDDALPPPSRSWASDANQIDINELRALTFKNQVVNEFLDSTTKHFVVGSKGLGKTLLLTYKRSLLHEHYAGKEGKHAAVKFIPEGRPYLDLMGDLPSLGKSAIQLMSSLDSCKRLWSFAFRVAAVSHLSERQAEPSEDEREELRRFPAALRAMLEGRKAEPTVVLKQLIGMPFGELRQLLDRSEGFLEYKIRSLHSAVFIFVDKLDQALRRLPRDAWVSMQAGMIEAAWDLMNTNAHVKIFATIREEAFADYESDIKTNLHGATTALRYTKRDLRDMLEKLTYFYERVHLRDFVSLDIVSATRGARTEAPFDFIYRHTLGRPRDLVIIASEISRNRGSLDEHSFKRIVQETSAGLLVANVFNEMRVFLEILGDREARGRFLALLPHNVLTHDEMIDLWCRFHGFDREYYDLHGNEAEGVYHPFRELFDCGLLGVIQRDPVSGRRSQRFRQPRDAVGGSRRQLPSSPRYLLHPALQALVMQLAGGDGFAPFRHVVIGHGQPWPGYYGRLIEVQRELLRGAARGDEDTEDAVYELLSRFDAHIGAGESVDVARRLIASTAAFAELSRRLERVGWDELHLALLELFPAELAGSNPSSHPHPPPGAGPAASLEAGRRPFDPRRVVASTGPTGGTLTDGASRSGEYDGPDSTLGPTHRAEVAMLLIDIVDSTQFVERHGDTMLVEYLRGIRDKLTQDHSEPPRVIKGVGDGYLVVYDSVTAALLGARTLLESAADPAALRIVVHCGEVHVGVSDVFGAEVHRLFRLEKLDEDTRVGPRGEVTLPLPGRPLLSAEAVATLPGPERDSFVRVGAFRIKGFEEPAEVWVQRATVDDRR
jgi:serine/threonine protein kinase/class 3 adenylate cyclase